MRQRVSFVRTLMAEKDILLLDEPFGALDSITRGQMQEWLLHAMADVPRTVLLVTHDVEEALLLADRVVVLSAHPGHVVRGARLTHGAWIDPARDGHRPGVRPPARAGPRGSRMTSVEQQATDRSGAGSTVAAGAAPADDFADIVERKPSTLGRLVANYGAAASLVVVMLVAWQGIVHRRQPARVPDARADRGGSLARQRLGEHPRPGDLDDDPAEVLLGFAIATALGIGIAVVLHLFGPLRRAVYPLLIASQTVPSSCSPRSSSSSSVTASSPSSSS